MWMRFCSLSSKSFSMKAVSCFTGAMMLRWMCRFHTPMQMANTTQISIPSQSSGIRSAAISSSGTRLTSRQPIDESSSESVRYVVLLSVRLCCKPSAMSLQNDSGNRDSVFPSASQQRIICSSCSMSISAAPGVGRALRSVDCSRSRRAKMTQVPNFCRKRAPCRML